MINPFQVRLWTWDMGTGPHQIFPPPSPYFNYLWGQIMPNPPGHMYTDVPIKFQQLQACLHLFRYMSFKPLAAFMESTIIKYFQHMYCAQYRKGIDSLIDVFQRWKRFLPFYGILFLPISLFLLFRIQQNVKFIISFSFLALCISFP